MKQRPPSLAPLLRSDTTSARRWVGRRTSDPAVVTRLCMDPSWNVREHAGMNPIATDADRVAVGLLPGGSTS